LPQENIPFSVTRAHFSDSLWAANKENSMQIYIHRNNEQLGPFTEAEVRAQLAAGTISPQDNVWWQGQPGWIPLAQSSLMAPATPGLTPPPAQVGFAPQPTSKLAIWALVCGCLSLLCGLFASIPAIILGHMALGETKKNPAVSGKGMALAGMILGYVFTTLIVLYLIAIVVLIAMGHQVQDVFKTIQAQENADTTNSADQPASSSDQTTNAADQTTNSTDQPAAAPATSPDQSTNSATATPATPDQSTTNSDTSTNSAPASTNTAPMSQ
jgi:uncharacterized membrane protein